jgi:hypothetical protein
MIGNRINQQKDFQIETDPQTTPRVQAIRNFFELDNPISNPLNNLFQAIKHVD